ncbi:MAG: hypothetical protein KDA41_10080, partial [Planctomycetales bacterium]|nr:hypothetical protein [Planctomycetales bacterium]
LFDLPGFTPVLLQAGYDDFIAYDVQFLGASMGTNFSALLTLNTSVGPLSYTLSATAAIVPEPSSILLWSMFGVAAAVIGLRRRKLAA